MDRKQEILQRQPLTAEQWAALGVSLLSKRGSVTPVKLERKAPSLVRKGVNYAKAVVDHRRAGKPIVPQLVVEKRFAICRENSCGLFQRIDDNSGTCLHESCGCGLKRVNLEGKSKLEWGEQKCPMSLWGVFYPLPVIEKVDKI